MKKCKITFICFTDIEDFKGSDDANSSDTKIQNLKNELETKDAIIEQLQFQISQMQKHYQDWVERSESNPVGNSTNEVEPFQRNNVAEIPMDDDHGYFASYAHFNIHHEMLSVSNFLNNFLCVVHSLKQITCIPNSIYINKFLIFFSLRIGYSPNG